MNPLLIASLVSLVIAFISAVLTFTRSEIDGIPVTTGIVCLAAFAFAFGLGFAYLIVLAVEQMTGG